MEISQLRWFGHDAKCLRKDSLNKLYLPKQMGKDQLYDLEPDGQITSRNLDEIAWDFIQAKWCSWWKNVKYGGLISSSCSRKHHGKAGNEERRRILLQWTLRQRVAYLAPNAVKALHSPNFEVKNLLEFYIKASKLEVFQRLLTINWLLTINKSSSM